MRKDNQITIRVSSKDLKRWKAQAIKCHTTLTNFIAMLVERAVDDTGKK